MIRSIRTLRIRQLTGFDLSMFVPTSPLWIHCECRESFSWPFAGVSPPGQLRESTPFAENSSTGKTKLAHTQTRLAKRRRALRERNPSRNSQSETHLNDEIGRGT